MIFICFYYCITYITHILRSNNEQVPYSLDQIIHCLHTSADDRFDRDKRRVDFLGKFAHGLIRILVCVWVNVGLDSARGREQGHRHCRRKTVQFIYIFCIFENSLFQKKRQKVFFAVQQNKRIGFANVLSICGLYMQVFLIKVVFGFQDEGYATARATVCDTLVGKG